MDGWVESRYDSAKSRMRTVDNAPSPGWRCEQLPLVLAEPGEVLQPPLPWFVVANFLGLDRPLALEVSGLFLCLPYSLHEHRKRPEGAQFLN